VLLIGMGRGRRSLRVTSTKILLDEPKNEPGKGGGVLNTQTLPPLENAHAKTTRAYTHAQLTHKNGTAQMVARMSPAQPAESTLKAKRLFFCPL
jgi:hypothetical protein